MAKLYFKYGAMGCSKTAQALMCKFNYEEKGFKVLLIKSAIDNRDTSTDGKIIIKSRIGLSAECETFDKNTNLFEFVKQRDFLTPSSVVIVDEVQFLTRAQIEQLKEVSDYAKTEYDKKYGQYVLKKANAGKKDQSYVLYNLPKAMLDKFLLPLGDFHNKDEIRKIAHDNNLPVASKPDSEDICFIPDGNYAKFLEDNSNLKPTPGNIVMHDGTIVGRHKGLYNYTIGQRKGIGVTHPTPLYVLGFNKAKNELIVGEENELYKDKMLVNNYNFLIDFDHSKPLEVNVKIRYQSKDNPAKILVIGDKIEVTFDHPVARITPGQSTVFYIDDIVVGGGKII